MGGTPTNFVTLLATRSYKNVTGLPAEVELHEVHSMQVRLEAADMNDAGTLCLALFCPEHRMP